MTKIGIGLGVVAVGAVGVLIALNAGYNGPDAGYIRQHRYDDPDQTWISGYTIQGSCSGGYNGAPRTCGPDTVIPGHWDYDPAHWALKIDDGEKSDWFYVDVDTYNRAHDGQWFDTKTGQVVPR